VVSARYTVISADGHAGNTVTGYRSYLEARWHDDFDAWAREFVNPFQDLSAPNADRNWNSDRRLRETEADGIVAEVLFPNTVPPFFPSNGLTAGLPSRTEYERRWAGLRAHNRWMADFCQQVPGRRAGTVQILLNDVDDALAEIRWARDALPTFGGVLVPGVPPNHPDVAPLFHARYEPIWALCEDLDIPVDHHGGTGVPDFGLDARGRAMMLVELPWFAHRALWHLIFAGVFERHPRLRFVLTEQGTGWIPGGLRTLDWFYDRMTTEGAAEQMFGGAACAALSLRPSEYFARSCYVGASFMRPAEAEMRHDVGVERLMWGQDYPHSEGTYPYSREALRASFAAIDDDERRRLLAGTAAEVYGFDLDALGAVAERVGPTAEELRVPLGMEQYPADSTSNAFERHRIIRVW
jgi:predicted TIM-barrel fold metal-dependent hydrolase